MSDAAAPRDARGPVAPPALDADRGAAASGRGGPYLLLLPLAVALPILWWVREVRDGGLPTRPPQREDPEATHDVLGGELTVGTATLAFWLAPAEPDPARQAFQSKALRKQYALPEGGIWRLRLELRAEAAPGGAAPPDALRALDVAGLAVEDDAGRALEPLALARPLDPLATLLAPPRQPLAPGTGLDLFLWGRAPGAGARLSGLGGAEAELALRPRALRLGELAGPLARVDPSSARENAAPDGKSAPAGTSKVPVRGSDDARY